MDLRQGFEVFLFGIRNKRSDREKTTTTIDRMCPEIHPTYVRTQQSTPRFGRVTYNNDDKQLWWW